ncbi:MAG: dihydrolipoamide acetyltransferase family protein [Gammaproteobacteria bacterium]|nr:dihydrolipoamide acetyltransferase family protein [Gammaproteobacteria bacterium]MDE0258382.1 dihydrolipoamide acetyltransferase family protein [Gammaproteobacteria bacterium]
MATKVHMEALSPTMEEGQVVKWLKAEGDQVAAGDLLAEIETDKATMELVARGDGVLRAILLSEGQAAPVGDVIAVIAAVDEDVSALVAAAGPASTASPATEAEEEPVRTAAPTATPPSPAVPPATTPPPTTPPPTPPVVRADTPAAPAAEARQDGGRLRASPVARRLASEAGLRLEAVVGSGPRGRIVKRDIEAALAAGTATAPAPIPDVPGEDFVDVPLTQIRKTIARRLVESLGPVPHFFLTADVDMARATELRRQFNELELGARISVNDIVIKATALALARHPECNAWWGGDHVRRHNRVHIGVAVAIDDGLITPVVRDAHARPIADISNEVKELAALARAKRLTPDQYTGSTFSISNLGMFGIEQFTGVINPPEAGILAVGAVEERPVALDGRVVVRPRMRITMSCDHRIIDGAQGARFLATLKDILEKPLSVLL